MMMPSTIMLDVRNVKKQFGGFVAVNGVSLSLAAGERRALIGPNGAGKTTLFNLLSGRLAPDEGDVLYKGTSILRVSPSDICKRGMARTFQITSVFVKLSVIQNVQTALYAHRRRSHWLLRNAAGVLRDEAFTLLDMVGIRALAERTAGLLSYGDQKRLELAMVMALEPQLLLLDEPTAGVELNTRRELVALIKDLCTRKQLTLLFCEHDMDAVFSIADQITVLHQGQILAEGPPGEISNNPKVREIYLGAEHGRVA
jgi:branched-chain amino acid transport system ATP-binding protein